MHHSRRHHFALGTLAAALLAACSPMPSPVYDLVIRGGQLHDGSGGPAITADIAVSGDRIAAIGPSLPGLGRQEIQAEGHAVAPGFINMLSWGTRNLFEDGRGQSDLRQGVTLQIFGEGSSLGPLSNAMKEAEGSQAWATLGEALEALERSGVSSNIASFVGAGTLRENVLGPHNVRTTPAQLARMQALTRQAMEEGAFGVGSSLIYTPDTFADTDELAALARVAGQCGGMYISHMRSETDHILEAVDETIEISRRSGAPAEIYHLKIGGRENWGKLDAVIARIEQARADGLRITTDMYPYPASATGLDASMPPWVREGGYDAWAERLRQPGIRRRVIAEMRAAKNDWENLYRAVGGPEHILLVGFQNPELRPLVGKTLAEVAALRGTTPEDTAMDLVIEDGSRVGVAYFGMSEDNQKRQMRLPYMSFGSDGTALTAAGEVLEQRPHPRSYGTFARILGHYVREAQVLTLAEAIHRMTGLPASNLGLQDRGLLKPGYYADIVVFDPARITDHSTFADPHRYATGVSTVVVNGGLALADGEPTGADTGRFVRGRSWTGHADGGCRDDATKWNWGGLD